MKSKIKGITYLLPILIMTFVIFIFIVTTIDNTIAIYSLQWWIFLLVILGLFSMFLFSFKKIPKIEIKNSTISYYSINKQIQLKIEEISKIEQVISKINGWYSLRGGIIIHTENEKLVFPYHIYSNESKMLQLIHQNKELEIEKDCNFNFSNIFYLKYFYRNFGSIYLILIIPFISILINFKASDVLGIIIISGIIVLSVVAFHMTSKYIKIENGNLYHISPILFRSCKYDLKNIKYTNSNLINTGNGRIKNLTIELVDNQILTLSAGLNIQSSLAEIADELNTMSNNR